MSGEDTIGLCARCPHVRIIESERGSRFYLCQAARNDARLRKYPRLPVLTCVAFSPPEQR